MDSKGFTLIEVVIALGILSFGILSVMIMQVSGIKGNATANIITSEANWATDRVEQLLALDYDDPQLIDNGNGVLGLDDATIAEADGNATSPDGRYIVFWNIANYMTPNPLAPSDSAIKAIRVIVQSNNAGITNEVVLNYYKQKLF